MRILILPLVIVFLCCSIDSFSQGTNCSNAFDISVSNTCSSPATISTTTGNPLTPSTCSGAGRITWLSFVAGTTCPVISFDITTSTSFQVAAYTTCAGTVESGLVPNSTACFASARGVWSPSASLTNGATYYLRVWTNSTGTIRACNIGNDAKPLDVDGGCQSFAMATTLGFPAGSCASNALRNVTWFKFVASTTCPMLSIDNSNSTPGTPIANEVSLYQACGNTNATLSPVAGATTCTANGSTVWTPPTATPLVVGNTYYLRVWTNIAAAGNLNICNVANVAQDLPLDASCYDLEQSYAASGGTVSSIASCPMATNPNRRITWVRFQTSAANRCVTVNITNPSVKTEVAMYGSGCGAAITNGTSLCLNDGVGVWSAGPNFPTNGYTPGTSYYLRIYSDIAPGSSYQPITLCGTERVQAVNDDCANAAAFNYTPGTYNNACAHFVNNEGLANGNGTEAAKICAYSMQNTVWYKFKVRNGAAGRATVTISNIDCDSYNNSNQLLQMGLLTGTCNSFAPAISPGPSGTPAFPVNNTPAAPTSCLAATGAGPYNLYTSNSVTTGQVIYLAIDGYSGANCRFTLQASDNIQPIPIHLKYFTAWKMKTANLIRWVTSFEHNNAYFDIERSIDGTNFEAIGRVPGSESQADKVYDFEDKFPPASAYYRLKQVDIDGKYEYSNTVQLIRDENIRLAVSVMPNPVLNTGRIVINAEKNGNVSLNIVDVAGRQVSSDIYGCVKGSNLFVKDFSKLPSGTYHLVISQNGTKAIKTFVKQ